ncbi:hypothetical protein NR798_22455 [Archangium gephyra]|uniref:hypothetical protein n=1 Tax=Archangium gephyra TaxID=48 RepID=UPI0035D3FA17
MRLDIEAACGVLQKLQEEIGSPPGTEPLRTAALALHFIWGNGHLHNFEDYLACFNQGDSPPSPFSFETREQAEASLQQAMDPRHAHSVAIAGTRYAVAYSPERGVRFLVRIPESAGLTTTTQPLTPLMREALAALRQARAHVRTPEDKESVDIALLAIHYILESGQSPLFEDFLGNFDSNTPRSPLCTFGTREEADTWLNAHPRPPHSASVEIAGQRYSVGYARDSGLRVLVRRPPLEELGLTEQDE